MSAPVLPEHILRLMSPEDRKLLGNSGFTAEEVTKLYNARKEKEMHEIFGDWLRLSRTPFIHARTDKRSTIAVGAPDFTVMHQGRAICIEFKMPGETQSEEQIKFQNLLQESGTPYFICTKAIEAIEHVRNLKNQTK